jgi:hypothetical protein
LARLTLLGVAGCETKPQRGLPQAAKMSAANAICSSQRFTPFKGALAGLAPVH